MIPISEYWHAVAKAIDAEDEKLRQFVFHTGELGTAREAILRQFLVTHTPEPFRIETGFICHFMTKVGAPEPEGRWTSKQCDLIVYNPQFERPYYSIQNLVVVPRDAAMAVVEVKTDLRTKTFQHMLAVREDTHWLPVAVLGFAYDGWEFERFVTHLTQAIRDRETGVPDCICVHRRNYVFIRSGYHLALKPGRHRPARYQLAVNFGATESNYGLASGCFLDTFLRLVASSRQISINTYLPLWFNKLPLPNAAKLVIEDDGTVSGSSLPTG